MRLAQLARGCENRIKRQTEGDITEEDLVKFLIDDDNQDELITLEGKLKTKKLAAV